MDMVILIRFRGVRGNPAFVNPEMVQSVEVGYYKGRKDGKWVDTPCTTIYQQDRRSIDVVENPVVVSKMLMMIAQE